MLLSKTSLKWLAYILEVRARLDKSGMLDYLKQFLCRQKSTLVGTSDASKGVVLTLRTISSSSKNE
jgi:hypothetical protein